MWTRRGRLPSRKYNRSHLLGWRTHTRSERWMLSVKYHWSRMRMLSNRWAEVSLEIKTSKPCHKAVDGYQDSKRAKTHQWWWNGKNEASLVGILESLRPVSKRRRKPFRVFISEGWIITSTYLLWTIDPIYLWTGALLPTCSCLTPFKNPIVQRCKIHQHNLLFKLTAVLCQQWPNEFQVATLKMVNCNETHK